jgi:sterol desaturase/sphingolipid hydroxylase (fatty acid hydroxylase superfamily)
MENIKYNQILHVCIIPILVIVTMYYLTHYFFETIEKSNTKKLQKEILSKKIKKKIEKRSNKNLFVGAIIYAFFYFILQKISTESYEFNHIEFIKLFAMLFIADTFFYWSHRLLHTSLFYEKCHKLHHTIKNPNSHTAIYVDWGEFFIAIGGSFLLPPIVIGLISNFSLSTLNFYNIIIVFSLIMSHSGYDFDFISAKHHDDHHKYFIGNYGSRHGIWDKLMGTKLDDKSYDKLNLKYVIIDNEKYDMAEWITLHPGGSNVIEKNLGKDITKIYNIIHGKNKDKNKKILEKYKIIQ